MKRDKYGKIFLVLIFVFSLWVFLPAEKAQAGTQIKTVEFYVWQYAPNALTATAATTISNGQGIKATAWPGECGGANDASVTVNLPESGITIRKAWVEWFTDSNGLADSTNQMRFCRSGGASTSTTSFTNVRSADGLENFPVYLMQDVTSQILAGEQTYFFNARLTGTTANTRSADNAKLFITYEYDDTSATQLKTVKYFVGCNTLEQAAGDTDSYTVNPNIIEANATTAQSFIEYSGQAEGNDNTDGIVFAGFNGQNPSLAAGIDDVNRSTHEWRTLWVTATSSIQFKANNTITLVNNNDPEYLKCGEWTINYTYTASNNELRTVRYAMGQDIDALNDLVQDTIGTKTINLPDLTSATSSIRSAWLHFHGEPDAVSSITPRVSVPGASSTGPAFAFGFKTNVGMIHIVWDITAFLKARWRNGDSMAVAGQCAAAGACDVFFAEFFVTYAYSNSTTTGIKTVQYMAAQDTVQNTAGTAFSTNTLSTFLPETGTRTFRNGGTVGSVLAGQANADMTITVTLDSADVAGTDTVAPVGGPNTEEHDHRALLSHVSGGQLTNASQSNVTTSLNHTGAVHLSGAMTYTTYEYQIPQPVFEQSAFRFFENANSTQVGSTTLTALQDTAATLTSASQNFRLRALLHVASAATFPGINTLKLQFSTSTAGGCDVSYSGETYVDVETGAGYIRYLNNAAPADGDAAPTTTTDPLHGADTVRNQSYEEANNFTAVATTTAGEDGNWDFSLDDNAAPAGTTYCFRVVYSDDTTIATSVDTKIPEITTASVTITISGTLYSDEGVSQLGGGRTIAMRINGSSYFTTTTNPGAGAGAWHIDSITNIAAGVPLIVYATTADHSFFAATVTKASSTDAFTGLDLYQNRVIVKHEASSGTSTDNTDLALWDATNDSDIAFDVSGTALTVATSSKLYIWPGKTFAPGGTITMLGNAQSAPGGDIHITNDATLTAGGNISLSGSWIASSTATFTPSTFVVTMTATTTGKEIWASNVTTSDFYDLIFDGSGGTGGAWTFKSDATTTHDATITDGTVTAPANLYVGNNYSNTGTLTAGTGTVWLMASDAGNSLTPGSSAFYNLNFSTSSDGAGGAWSISGSSATTTNNFTITAGAVTAPANLYITGNYSNSGTFTHNSGKIIFNATAAKTITAGGVTSDFFQLDFNGAGGQWTFVGAATSTATTTITQGTLVQAADANLDLASFSIGASGVFTAASGSGVLFFEATDPIFIADNRASKTTLGDVNIGYSPATANQSTDLVVDSFTVNSGDRHNTRGFELDVATFVTVNGTGILDASSSAAGETNGTIINVGTNWTVAAGATFTAEEPGTASTTVIFDENTASTITPGAVDANHDFWNFTVQKSGAATVTLAGAIDINNDIDILTANSTFDVSASNYQINAGGSWNNTGVFTARNGTVVFDSSVLTETITPGNSAFASTTFNNALGGWTFSGSSVTTTDNFTIRNGNVTSTSGILYIGGNASTSNSAFFGHNSGNVQLYGTVSAFLNSGCSAADTCSNDFYDLVINKTTAGNDTVTTTNHLRIANILTLTDGIFYQGSSGEIFDLRVESNATAISVAAAGTLTNHGRGDLILGGDVSNAGTIDFKSDNQNCSSPNQADEIFIHSTTTPNTTAWSGAGTFTMFHIQVQDQVGTASITVSGGTNVSGNGANWTFTNCGVTISGTLYSNEGATQLGGGQTINMRINGTSYFVTTTNPGATAGLWHIDGVSGFSTGTPLIVYTTTTNSSVFAFVITKSSSTDAFTGLDLYQNRVIIKHEASSGTSTDNTDLGLWDKTNDSQIQFDVSGTSLTVATTSKLYIWPNKTFAPGGTITTAGDGANWVYPGGDLQITEGATLTAGGNISVSGSWIASSTAVFTPGTFIVTMTATTTGKEIWASSTAADFYDLTFDGSGGTGGGWTFKSQATTTNNFTINDGTVTLPSSNLYVGGNYFVDEAAVFTHNSGTVLFNSTAAGKTVDDGGDNFFNIIFDGVGGEWLYQDGTSTSPNLITVRNGTSTLLNARTGASPVVSGTGVLLVDWYLGVNLIDATNTGQIDTDTCSDLTISENTASSTVFRYTGSTWGSGLNSTTTGTGTACGGPSAGISPQPGTAGAVKIREYMRTANGTSTYKYNLKVAWQANYGAYDWSADYGSDGFLFSSSTNGSFNVVGEKWHRNSSTTINSPYSCSAGSGDACLNQAPTNGSWYGGLITGLIFSIPSGFSVSLGNLDAVNDWTASASTTLNVKTSASNGYSITAWALNDGRMQLENLGIYISKYGGSNAAPQEWNQNCSANSACCGFGYSTDDSTLSNGTANRFTSGASTCSGAGAAGTRAYAGFAIVGPGDIVGDFASPTTTATTTITYRASVDSAQAAGKYQTTIIYIATPNY